MKTIITLIFILRTFSVFSESTAERLKRVKDRTLIVELPVKDVEYINHLIGKGKKVEADDYEERHARIVEALKTSFSKFWTYNEKMVFVPSDSIKTFIGVYPQYYVVMRYGERQRLLMDKFTINYIAPKDGVRYMSLCLPGELKEVLFCLSPQRAALGEFIISIHEFNFAINVYLTHPTLEETYVNAYTKAREDKPRYEIKNLTVLIKREDIDEKKANEEKIAKVYPYKYKIVERKEWEEALLNRREGFACYVTYLVPYTHSIYKDTNGNGNMFDDLSTTEKGYFLVKGVCSVYDGHGELATLAKDLPKEMAEFKKQLAKSEKKANQPKKE